MDKILMAIHELELEHDSRPKRSKKKGPKPSPRFGSVREWATHKGAKRNKKIRLESPTEGKAHFYPPIGEESQHFRVKGILYPCGETLPVEYWRKMGEKPPLPKVPESQCKNIIEDVQKASKIRFKITPKNG